MRNSPCQVRITPEHSVTAQLKVTLHDVRREREETRTSRGATDNAGKQSTVCFTQYTKAAKDTRHLMEFYKFSTTLIYKDNWKFYPLMLELTGLHEREKAQENVKENNG